MQAVETKVDDSLQAIHPEVVKGRWPEVNFYTSFSMPASLHYLDEDKKLVPYQDMVITQHCDAEGNRELFDTVKTVEGQGKTQELKYLDFNAKTVTTYNPHTKSVEVAPLEINFNVKEFMSKAFDPESGIFTYVGETTLPFSPEQTFYEFKLNEVEAMPSKGQTWFFNKDTKNLQHVITRDIGDRELITVTEGPTPITFTDDFFKVPKSE
jgi:hypothetical protein